MNVRRSRFELMLDILNVIIEGETKPTRIMYRANFSWRSLNDILKHLVVNGLVDEQRIQSGKREMKRYDITEKGRNVVNYYQNLAGLINTENPQLDF